MFRISLLSGLVNGAVLATLAGVAIALPIPTSAQSAPQAQPAETGCLSGYPNGTFQGNRPASRNEFAAGMNACLDRVNTLIPNQADFATKAELDTLIQRQRELNQQLRELSDRVGNDIGELPSSTPQ